MAIADLSGHPDLPQQGRSEMVEFDTWDEARERRGIHYVFPEDRQFVNEVLWPAVLEKGSWSGEYGFATSRPAIRSQSSTRAFGSTTQKPGSP